jgi:hypothetical protein
MLQVITEVTLRVTATDPHYDVLGVQIAGLGEDNARASRHVPLKRGLRQILPWVYRYQGWVRTIPRASRRVSL